MKAEALSFCPGHHYMSRAKNSAWHIEGAQQIFMHNQMKKGSEWKNLSHFASTALHTILSFLSSGKSFRIYVGLNFSGSFYALSTCHINCPDIKYRLALNVWNPSIHLIYKFLECGANWISHAFFHLLLYLWIINLSYSFSFLQCLT